TTPWRTISSVQSFPFLQFSPRKPRIRASLFFLSRDVCRTFSCRIQCMHLALPNGRIFLLLHPPVRIRPQLRGQQAGWAALDARTDDPRPEKTRNSDKHKIDKVGKNK